MSTPDDKVAVVYVTVPADTAVTSFGKELAKLVVKEKLAACVNIVPGG